MTLRQRIFLLGFVAIAGMCFALWLQYVHRGTEYRAIGAVSRNVEAVVALSALAHELQRERGLTVFALAGAHHPTPFAEEVARTDAALARLVKTGWMPPGFDAALAQLRAMIAAGQSAPLMTRDDFSVLLRTLIDEMDRLAREPLVALVKDDISAHAHLVALKEYLGQLRATLVYWLVNPQDERRAFESLIRIKSLFDEAWRKFERDASPPLREAFRARFAGTEVEATLETIQSTQMSGRPPAGLAAQTWLHIATASIDRLFDIENRSLQLIERKAADRMRALRAELMLDAAITLTATLFVLILTISAIVSLLRALTRTLTGMEQIAASRDFRSRIPDGSPDEIGRIARSFNALLGIAEQLLREKEHLAATDTLTGINNRLRFAQVLDEEAQRKRRNKTPMALVLFDIDHFKQVNDRYGHNIGDDILKRLTRLVKTEIRNTDFFGRWGGEEFILLLRDDNCDAAFAAAEKLRKLIAATKFPGVDTVITCSFGVTAWEEADTADSLVSRADHALYASKNHGRNQVSCARSTGEGCRGLAACGR